MSLKRFAVRLLEYGLLALGLVAAAGLSALVTMRAVLLSQEVKVPSLVGRSVPDAGAVAARHRLQVRVEGKRNDPRVPIDSVIAQEPPAGATLKTGRSIRLWLSLGPKRISVPAVEGETLRTGRLTLEQAQVPVGRVVEVADRAPAGTILMQRPAPGEADEVPGGASLLVSLGQAAPEYVMPDLIGRLAAEVVPALQGAGLQVAPVRERSYPGAAPGIVLRQVPPAGYRINALTPLTLDVSRAE